MKRILAALIGMVVLAVIAFGMGTAAPTSEPTFPHAKHQKLFPVCEGCHAGLISGNAADAFPDASDCARCHDGERVDSVGWQQRTPRASNLRFDHVNHRELSAQAGARDSARAAAGRLRSDADAQPRRGVSADCHSCHAAGGEPARMNIDAANATRCIGCHEHAAETHMAGTALCARCHIPLVGAATLPIDRIAKLPKPEWHLADDYVSTHGARARDVSCAVCHARETCERCHANADQLPAITALGRDARVAVLEAGRRPTYPLPSSHSNNEWADTHGARALSDATSCANCHTPPSCTGCHRQTNAAIASLPAPLAGAAGGVSVRSTVHAADIATRHGSLAASGRFECARCHTADVCSACHAGADSRAFHVANFVERHATDVFASGSDCQSCHNTETFCRTCHARAGIAASAAMNAAFHNGQPMWVLTHGQAARTGMEACASCHRQNDCVRCHSAAGGWGVNPHGSGYAASRIAARNTTTCSWCHLSNPLGRNR